MKYTPRTRTQAIALVAVVIVWPAAARAQQPTWQNDYATARKLAFEKGKPLLIDFGAEYCSWCKKLDATTFVDPGVVAILSQRFVCLRVDGEREVNLTQALRIQTYPTVVLAAPDGKILETIEGYVDAAQMTARLNRAAPGVVSPAPDWMIRDFQEAARSIAVSDYSRAIVLLKNVVKDGDDRSIQTKSRQVLADLEQQATMQLSLARTLNQRGRSQEAVDVLTDLLRSYAGTNAASDSATLLTALAAKPEVREGMRIRKARELLAHAKEDFQSQHFLGALERCELLAASFADLNEGVEAKKMVGLIQENPEYLAKACDALNHRTCAMYLALADTWIKKGQPAQAVECLERVVQIAPGSQNADTAQLRLAALQPQQRTSAYPPDKK